MAACMLFDLGDRDRVDTLQCTPAVCFIGEGAGIGLPLSLKSAPVGDSAATPQPEELSRLFSLRTPGTPALDSRLGRGTRSASRRRAAPGSSAASGSPPSMGSRSSVLQTSPPRPRTEPRLSGVPAEVGSMWSCGLSCADQPRGPICVHRRVARSPQPLARVVAARAPPHFGP
jgi:hypothetical protein